MLGRQQVLPKGSLFDAEEALFEAGLHPRGWGDGRHSSDQSQQMALPERMFRGEVSVRGNTARDSVALLPIEKPECVLTREQRHVVGDGHVWSPIRPVSF